jgi:hypothetical protein
MKRAIDFELLAQLAGKGRDSQESDCSSLRILVERDMARLAQDLANPRTTQSCDALIDVSANWAPVIEKSPDGGAESDFGTAIDVSASAPQMDGDDPDDRIDPDDQGNVDSFYAISPGRWAELVSGSDRDPVSAEVARAVFHSIGQRLALGQTAQTPSLPPQADTLARLTAPEDGSGAPILSSALPGTSKDDVTAGDAEAGSNAPVLTTEDKIASGEAISRVTTVGQLHEVIEAHFGQSGWETLVRIWHTQAGIEPPTRVHASITNRIPEGELSQPQNRACSLAREAEAIAGLPGAVRRFWLREPPVPPAWRRQESEAERQWREDREGDGAWCG